MMLNESAYIKLKNIRRSQQNTEFVVVKGNYGLGKTYLIDQFIQNEGLACISVYQKPSEAHPLESMVNAILNYYIEQNQDINIESFLQKRMSYEAVIRKELYDIYASTDKVVMLFENVDQYSGEFLDYICQFIKNTISAQYNFSILILLEYNMDRAGNIHKQAIYQLEQLVNPDRIIQLKEQTAEILEPYICVILLHNRSQIPSNIIHQLIIAAFRNPLYIIRLVGELREKNLIYDDDGYWKSKPLDSYMLTKCVEDYIARKYSSLNDTSKEVIMKASTTGYVIDMELLERPLSIPTARSKLINIEQQTQLIIQEDDYHFSTPEVYEYISGLCLSDQKGTWHGLIGRYLESLLSRANSINPTMGDLIQYFRIGNHFEYSGEYVKALQYYILCISVSNELEDYKMLKSVCEKARLILHKTPYHKDRGFWITYYYAVSIDKAGEYKEAAALYKQLISTGDSYCYSRLIAFIRYKLAYALYNCGDHFRAKDELQKLLELIRKEKDNTATLVKVLDLLSAIFNHIGENIQSERYFKGAVDIAIKLQDQTYYHSLMRKSGMFYTEELSIPYLHKSLEFFRSSNDKWETALAAYNLGTSYIYLAQVESGLEFIRESEMIFKSYNSKNIHYPLNAMGVIYAIKGDYGTALTYLLFAHKSITEFFSDVYILLNQSHCYRLLGQTDECERILVECSEKVKEHFGNTFYLERNLSFSYGMLYYDKKEYQQAMKKIEEAFDIAHNKLKKTDYCDLFAAHLINLSKQTSLPLSEEVLAFKNAHLSDYSLYLYDTRVLWGNFMFWGM
jgi:tetratricopeptide (TPR) repeat protein